MIHVCMYVCMYVCIFIKLHIPRNPALSSESFYATRIDPPKGGSMILMYVFMYVYIFIKLHITAQSGPVIRVILCHSH